MGRKKRKTAVEEESADAAVSSANDAVLLPPPPPPPLALKQEENQSPADAALSQQPPSNNNEEDVANKQEKSSKYAMSSHSGNIVREDIYISDGSEDEDEDVDVVLAASRSGMMRRGLVTPVMTMIQPNRQWVRPGDDAATVGEGSVTLQQESQEDAEKRRQEELEKLDPVQRAARLQAEKQRLEEQEKIQARIQESQENAGREPSLFSKRTAFDIRFDQMDDKPWTRSTDLSDFFNYGLDEQSWLEYAQQQLAIRQELTDASRNQRPPDPNIVPVTPQTPALQAPRVAVAATSGEGDSEQKDAENTEAADPALPVQEPENETPLGPSLPESRTAAPTQSLSTRAPQQDAGDQEELGIGGAWGAVPDSHLAQLMEEQERQNHPHQQEHLHEDRGQDYLPPEPTGEQAYYGHQAPPPPPPHYNSNNNEGGGYHHNSRHSSQEGSNYGGGDRYGEPASYGGSYGDGGRGGYGRGGGRGFRGRGRGGRGGGWGGPWGGPPGRGGGSDNDYYNDRKRNREWRR